MPFQQTPPGLTAVGLGTVTTDMQDIIDLLTAVNINLTKVERSGASAVGDKRLPFMIDYYGNKNDYASLKPTFMSELEADAHWSIAQQLGNIELKALKVLELVTDIRINSEHFAHKYGLEGYAVVGRAVEQNVPGADTFYDLLKRHFAQDPATPEVPGNATTPPTPGETDTTSPPAPTS
ncbi:MAG: hypothetical protein KBF73_10565 [Flavobacteriales bacterium]|nr:hypothetical protein [Flavobacteriales bacterium]